MEKAEAGNRAEIRNRVDGGKWAEAGNRMKVENRAEVENGGAGICVGFMGERPEWTRHFPAAETPKQ